MLLLLSAARGAGPSPRSYLFLMLKLPTFCGYMNLGFFYSSVLCVSEVSLLLTSLRGSLPASPCQPGAEERLGLTSSPCSAILSLPHVRSFLAQPKVTAVSVLILLLSLLLFYFQEACYFLLRKSNFLVSELESLIFP